MTSITQLCAHLQTLLLVTAVELAKRMQLRSRKFSPTTLAQTFIFGWLQHPQAGSGKLANVARKLGVQVKKQTIEDHFTVTTANWLLALLREAIRLAVSGSSASLALLQRFSAVFVEDGSTISLPASLRCYWKGCGGGKQGKEETEQTQASIKLTVRLDLLKGMLQGPYLHDGKTHDLKSELREQAMAKGSLWIADLGYFTLIWLASLARQGIFFLIRYKDGTTIWVEGKRRDLLELVPQALGEWKEIAIQLGASKQISARLLLLQVPQEALKQRRARIKEYARTHCKPINPRTWELAQWQVIVTNVPASMLTATEAMALLRARWQVELLFKLWKSWGRIDEWNTQKSERILCEVYAKLLAMLIQHWLLITSCWQEPDRSMTALAETMREQVPVLLHAFRGHLPWEQSLSLVVLSIAENAPIPDRRSRPSTAALLAGAPFWGLT